MKLQVCGREFPAERIVDPATSSIPLSQRKSIGVTFDWSGLDLETSGITFREVVTAFHRAIRQWNFALEVEFFLTSNKDAAKVFVKWVTHTTGAFATANRANGQESQKLNQAYAANYLWWNEDLLYRVAVHEFGHTLGIAHTPWDRRGMMNAGITDIRELTEHDIQAAVDLGYETH